MYGVSIARLILDESLQIASRLNMNEHILKHQLARYYYRASYMFDDLVILNAIEYITSHPEAAKVWEYLKNHKVNVNSMHSKYIDFKFGMFKIKLRYAAESLPGKLGRFQTLEYFPNSRLLSFLRRLK